MAILAASALVALSPLQVTANAATAAGPEPAPVAGQPDVHRVTLLTGDVVTYERDGAGHDTAQVEPAVRPDRPAPAFQITSTADGLMVYPSDALPFIGKGLLGPELFNVTTLVGDRRDDAASTTIPVIVRYGDRAGLSAQSLDAKAKSLPQTQRLTPLVTANGVGVQVKKAGTGDFWRSLVAFDPGGKPVLNQGISQVRLDRKVRVALDKSTAQVGAPSAWKSGWTGKGSTVAVVDTGIDEKHPDLAGKTTVSADFSGEGDAVDRHGHGTHVASIIAGTGAASGGRYKGVAPDAKLVVAKVFDASGEGDTAQVMAGIDWVVAQGAKVVNLSLGAGVTDGADPLSEQIDTLSAKSGALFVVASGNSGPGDRTVTTPGAATSALTVGAVDRDNKIAWFSSRGPRLRDASVKPEITAPGVGIVAARAADTAMGEPVDDNYTAASGTSMATPHVAGAAAILLQQQPGLTGQALKNTLVTTAKDVGLRWYEQGAGLLDVARAVSQKTTGTAVASFGRNERTTNSAAQVVRQLSYTNSGDQPLNLNLNLTVQPWDGVAKPGTGMRLAKTNLSIPPKSSTTVDLSVNPSEGVAGVYGGAVVATTADGTGSVRTPVSIYNAAELFPVTIRVRDSAGGPAQVASAQLIDDTAGAGNRNDPFLDQVNQQIGLVDGVGRVLVPAGRYSALGWAMERGLAVRRWSAMSSTQVAVSAPAEIALNAASAVPVGLVTPTPTDLRDRTVMLRRVIPGGAGVNGYVGEAGLSGGGGWEVRVTPAAATSAGAISLQDSATLTQTAVEMQVVGGGSKVLNPAYDVPTLTAKSPGERTLPVVFGGAGGASDLAGLDVRGKAVLVRIPVPAGSPDPVSAVSTGIANAARAVAGAGAAAMIPYAGSPGSLSVPGLSSAAMPTLSLGWDEGEALRTAGAVSVRLLVRAAPDVLYNLSYLDPNGVPKDLVRRVDKNSLVATKTGYQAEKPGLTGQKNWYAFPTGLWKTQAVQGTKIPVPGTWTEYTGPANDRLVWKRVVTLSGTDAAGRRAALSMNAQNIYRAGERSRPEEYWFRAPMHSGTVELPSDHPARYPATANGWTVLCSMCRGGMDPDLFVPGLQWMDGTAGAGSGGHYSNPYENARYFAATTARLYRDGTEIPRSNLDDPFALAPEFRLAPTPATYRLDVTDVMPGQAQIGAPSAALFQNAPRTDTSWTFASARSNATPPAGFSCYASGNACSFQPLIQLDQRLPLDLGGRAPAGRPYTFDVFAGSHSGARGGGPVTQLKVSSSTDGGRTWTAATARPNGTGLWSVTVDHPRLAATDGFVWLRSDARDSSGNTVTQTVQRAYALTDVAKTSPLAR
ncbi:peptidase S8 and S53 subtilisin kexin sedolisin [Amycolatopsis thailandensis]|uniref:Peptidase S8 and S53 subtilisin kexin sedolisin n=1 Tax=Amycolatopsis thailandensis TaxID=589330 RepID=A0A229SFD3_9PSEU|nr:S8 family peptidase [Amycolatopsis thailandensis]OXM57622.1 peptidase S8 and S53 subtilisin kexin sedolisin [Amycolatopsis thailandensis]